MTVLRHGGNASLGRSLQNVSGRLAANRKYSRIIAFVERTQHTIFMKIYCFSNLHRSRMGPLLVFTCLLAATVLLSQNIN